MFFLNVVFVTVLSLLAATSMVSASSNNVPIPQEIARQLTNARRLAKGYPLRAPRRRHDHHDRHDHWHHGTHTHEHRAAPSAGPGPSALQGCIYAIREQDGINLGYISKNYNSDNSIGLTVDSTQCLRFDLTGRPNLLTMNGPDDTRPFVGPVRQGEGLFYLTSLADTDMRASLNDNRRVELYQNDNKPYPACSQNNVLLIGVSCPLNDYVELKLDPEDVNHLRM